MRATRFFLFDVSGLAALLHLTRTEALTAVSRSAEIGVGAVHAIREPLSTRPRRISLDHDVGAGLVKAIQSSGKATVRSIHLGHLMCDSLDEASDSTRLQFAVGSNQTVIAERTSFSVMPGDDATGGVDRKVWMGDIVEPAPQPGSVPGTIGMTWTDPCDEESFFLRMVKRRTGRGASILTSVPCPDGVCMVEQDLLFHSQSASRTNQSDTVQNRRLYEEENEIKAATQSRRKLENTTEIDVLCLYSEEVRVKWGNLTSVQMESRIMTYFVEANEGNSNSLIPLTYNLFVRPLPHDQEAHSDDVLSGIAHSPEVAAMRNELGADLVHIVADTDDTCGVAYMFGGGSSTGFGLTHYECIDDFTLGHELGHNLGCNHDRDVEDDDDHPYAYGQRHCTGDKPYVTIMAYQDDCDVDYINYYSNPDVVVLGKPTGTAIENCARRIRDTMVEVSNYRQTGGGGCVSGGGACGSTSDCCDSTCEDGVCGACVNAGQSLGDGLCDSGLNTDVCGFDLGDCCECSCVGRCTVSSSSSSTSSSSLDDYYYDDDSGSDKGVGRQAFNCLDPDPICIACTEDRSLIGNGVCDEAVNSADCLFDGGDCCEYTCGGGESPSSSGSSSSGSSSSPSSTYYSSLCGTSGYRCIDPEVCSDEEASAECDESSSGTIDDDRNVSGASSLVAFSPVAAATVAAAAAGSTICAFRDIEGFIM